MLSIAGWRWESTARGTTVCTPPGGRALATIEIGQRPLAPVAPLPSLTPLRDLIARRFEALHARGVAALVIEPALRITTAEGEYAAIVTIHGILDAEPVAHTLGVIYADDFQLVIDGRAARADHRAVVRGAVREIVQYLPLGLGAGRYRRFWYQAPTGWRGVASGLVTEWSPVEHAAGSVIKVHPARPVQSHPGAMQLEALLRDDRFDDFVLERPIVRGDVEVGTLQGVIARAVGQFPGTGRRMIITAALSDRRHVYVMRLKSGETNIAEDEQRFLALVKSVAPLPAPLPTTDNPALAYLAT